MLNFFYEAKRNQAYVIASQQYAFFNQLNSMRHPKRDLGSLRSSYDFDGLASDAVEGRNKDLESYRLRDLKGR